MREFIQQTRSARAVFTQTVADSSGQVSQQSNGTVQFQRPGKFRWTYSKPYEQLIVGDGEKLWIYDKDLNQVTQRKLDKALGSSPAALLAGADDIKSISDSAPALGKRQTVLAEVRPYDRKAFRQCEWDSTLQRSKYGAYDHFGQKTTIRFQLERNPSLPPIPHIHNS